MCGRFSLSHLQFEDFMDRFHALKPSFSFLPRYNIAPGQDVLTMINWKGQNQFCLMKWGLFPYWSAKTPHPKPLINVRSESLIEKSIFKPYVEHQHCLILADGFFEWKKEGEKKIPFRAIVKDQPLFVFAGLWERFKTPAGQQSLCCTILTTEANTVLSPIHHRMPVILTEEKENSWLNPLSQSSNALDCLKPFPANKMNVYPVSSLVNSVKHDSIACIEPC